MCYGPADEKKTQPFRKNSFRLDHQLDETVEWSAPGTKPHIGESGGGYTPGGEGGKRRHGPIRWTLQPLATAAVLPPVFGDELGGGRTAATCHRVHTCR